MLHLPSKMQKASPGTVYIIVLNYNGTADTIDCLKSLRHLTYPHHKIILCDNGSTKASYDELTDWLRSVRRSYLLVDPEQLANARTAKIYVIKGGRNLGYAGGNNLGLRLALAQPDFQAAWILNNDTVVDPEALTALVNRCRQDSSIGQCGSLISYFQAPKTVQLQGGGHYNRLLGTTSHIGEGRAINDLISPPDVEAQLDYISGASLFVTRAFLETVGLMDEQLFLFYEELDWSLRNRGRFRLAYAPDSRVLHKVGAATGSTAQAASKSLTADYYGIHNRIVMSRRYRPWFLPTVYLGLILTFLKRLGRGQFNRAWMVVAIMLGIDRKPTQPS